MQDTYIKLTAYYIENSIKKINIDITQTWTSHFTAPTRDVANIRQSSGFPLQDILF